MIQAAMVMTILRIGKKIKSNGFTLLETLIVLIIISVCCIISIPLLSRLTESSKLKTAARNVASSLRTARSYAITNFREYRVVFTPSSTPQEYYIGYKDGLSIVQVDKTYKLPTGVWFYDPATPSGDGVDFSDNSVSNNSAKFKATGELDESADTSVFMSDSNTGGPSQVNTITVTVERTTGRTRISQ